ncbi:hypothetical protein V1527DRAFT_453234 [Lipomyces starkeyi]
MFGTLRDAFFETYRDTDAGIVKSGPVYLVKDGVDLTDAIPRDLTVKVGDFSLLILRRARLQRKNYF